VRDLDETARRLSEAEKLVFITAERDGQGWAVTVEDLSGPEPEVVRTLSDDRQGAVAMAETAERDRRSRGYAVMLSVEDEANLPQDSPGGTRPPGGQGQPTQATTTRERRPAMDTDRGTPRRPAP
jgi:hypothetical protein